MDDAVLCLYPSKQLRRFLPAGGVVRGSLDGLLPVDRCLLNTFRRNLIVILRVLPASDFRRNLLVENRSYVVRRDPTLCHPSGNDVPIVRVTQGREPAVVIRVIGGRNHGKTRWHIELYSSLILMVVPVRHTARCRGHHAR